MVGRMPILFKFKLKIDTKMIKIDNLAELTSNELMEIQGGGSGNLTDDILYGIGFAVGFASDSIRLTSSFLGSINRPLL